MSESISIVTLSLELVVTFAGVFLAFLLDRFIDLRKERGAKEELLENINCELTRLKDTLTGDAYRLYPDIWDSAVTSGKLGLLNSEQLAKLTNVYRKIKGTDYEAIRVRDAKAAFEQTGSHDARKDWAILSIAHSQRMQETRESIDEVLKEKWLNKGTIGA
jgi:hypothetical protein